MITLNMTFATVGEMHMALTAMLTGATPALPPVAEAPPAPKPVKVAKAVEAPKSEPAAVTPTVSATATPAPVEPAPAAPAPASHSSPITLEEVRAKLAALSQAGKTAAVKQLIASYGSEKLTAIPADKYADVLEKAAAL